MKIFKRLIALFVSVFIIIFSSVVTVSAANTKVFFGKDILSQMNNSKGLLYVYECLANGCENMQSTIIDVSNGESKITCSELSTVYRAFYADHPEYFWLDGGYKVTCEPNTEIVISVTPNYTMAGADLETAKSVLDAKVNELIKGLNTKSAYEKTLILHDRIVDTVEYIESANDQSIYGALVEGKAVCSGYAKAYQYLLRKVGVFAWCVIGTSINPATNKAETHEWNLVSIDGKWYYTDLTWDDHQKCVFYEFFNMTYEQLIQKHSIVDFKEYLPKTTATDANYFVKNNFVYSEFNLDKIAQNLKKGNNKTRLYINGDRKAFLTKLENNISSLAKKMGVTQNYGYSYSTISLDRETILTVNIVEPDHQHSLTSFAAKKPTCTTKGNITYYTCSCGKWFSDSNAVTEITDKQCVILPAVAHTPSDWKLDSNNHWKICTNCNIKISNSAQPHIDGDENNTCDICNYLLPTAESQSTVTTNSNIQNNVSNSSSANKESKQPQDATVSRPIEINSSDTTTKEETSREQTSSDVSSSVTQDTPENNNTELEKDISLYQIIIPCAAVVGVFATTLIIVIIKKRKS